MSRPVTAAQRAVQVTFILKGHLKNAQISYLRAAALLAKVRDEKLYAALQHPDMESYAARRLGLGRASLFRYLQIYDWVRRSHPGWLAKHPKGFIPELTDAHALMWIEERLEDEHLGPETRKELEALREQALAGTLAQSQLEAFRRRGLTRHDSLGAVAASLRAVRRRAAALADFPPALLREIDEILDGLKSASGAVAKAASVGKPRGMRVAAIGGKSLRA